MPWILLVLLLAGCASPQPQPPQLTLGTCVWTDLHDYANLLRRNGVAAEPLETLRHRIRSVPDAELGFPNRVDAYGAAAVAAGLLPAETELRLRRQWWRATRRSWLAPPRGIELGPALRDLR